MAMVILMMMINRKDGDANNIYMMIMIILMMVDEDYMMIMMIPSIPPYHLFHDNIGESDDLRKETSGDLFLLSGSSVATGYAHMLVTSVGEQSRYDYYDDDDSDDDEYDKERV